MIRSSGFLLHKVGHVTGAGVGAEAPFYADDEIGLGRFGHEMKMITHETPRMELPTGFLAGFTEAVEEPAAIRIVVEGGFTPVPTIHQVVNGPWK